jgi:hypothetical protein
MIFLIFFSKFGEIFPLKTMNMWYKYFIYWNLTQQKRAGDDIWNNLQINWMCYIPHNCKTYYVHIRKNIIANKWINVIYLFNQIASWLYHKIYHGFVRCSMDGVFVVSRCAFMCLLWAKDVLKALENVERVTTYLPWVIISGAQRVFVTLIVQHDIGINMP